MKKIKIAILGMGTVGGGTYEILNKQHNNIKKRQEVDIEVARVLERNIERCVAMGIDPSVVTTDINEIINDKTIDIVVEVMGGIEPAKTFITKCLESGKNIVTANKELLAKHWADLEAVAIEHNAGLYFEASCVGGVPIIRTLMEAMQGNYVQEIIGIYNGTTNYILTKMTEENVSYEDALLEAQKLGFAEANPASDVEAFDSTYKLSILSSLAFHTCIPYDIIYREGITGITQSDIECGKELGYVLKLLAIGKRHGNEIEVRVHPAFVPEGHPLASVRGSFNAVHLKGNNVGDIMLYGRGAGSLPTGSAIVSDIIYCAKLSEPKYTTFDNEGELSPKIKLLEDFESKYYFLLNCKNASGVLGKITTILGKHNVSVDSIIQKAQYRHDVKVLFLTELTQEKAMQAALNEIDKLDEVKKIESFIRVI